MDYDTSRCTASCHAKLEPCGHERAQALQKGLASITSVGPVVRQAEKLRQALIEVSRISTELQDELRQLLSYCREREVYRGRDNDIGADTAYGDVADKLAALLDGEGEMPPSPGPVFYWECHTCTFLAPSQGGAQQHEIRHPGHEMMRIREGD